MNEISSQFPKEHSKLARIGKEFSSINSGNDVKKNPTLGILNDIHLCYLKWPPHFLCLKYKIQLGVQFMTSYKNRHKCRLLIFLFD